MLLYNIILCVITACFIKFRIDLYVSAIAFKRHETKTEAIAYNVILLILAIWWGFVIF